MQIDYKLQHAIDVISDTYGVNVSIDEKKKNLLKWGNRTTVGTGWETMMVAVGSQTGETFVTGNDITHVVSTGADTGTINYEYHGLTGGVTVFGVASVTLNGTTAVALPNPAYRVSRAYNTGSSPLTGRISFYEGGSQTDGTPADDTEVHMTIEAGEQHTQKAQTTISNRDYWIISNFSLSVLAKVTKYAEGRIEVKPVGTSYWRPISQTVGCTDTTGTIQLSKEPYLIVPSNYDVRLAVRTNSSAVAVAGGINGYLASVINE